MFLKQRGCRDHGSKKDMRTHPLCHQLNLASVTVDFRVDRNNSKVDIEAKAKCTGQTGVEMEALTAVAVAALTSMTCAKPWTKA